jgi:anthranilate/para-aminobenzoate synthase component I
MAPRRRPRFGPFGEGDGDGDAHMRSIERVLAYIRAGDVFQVNLARRLRAPLVEPGDPLALLARDMPYAACLDTGDAQIVANSPELFLAKRGSRVESRPIKGTALSPDALRSEKELAEHLMIVDLVRNDLGRIARTGSVRVEDYARIEPFPTLNHLISTVACDTDAGIAAILRATFPGGSVTGAPKIRAMEIIDELEPVRRGPYTGAIGWIQAGDLELAMTIRTAVIARGAIHLHVGGGIVADSRPERELAETEEKAAAWRQILQEPQ